MTEQEYRALDRVSYSSLSKLASSPQAYKAGVEGQKEETSYMTLGTVVDMLLTDKKRFDDEVYVMTADKPSAETMLMYCNTLAETGDSIKAYQASGYKISPNAVSTKFDKEGRAYFDALLDAKGKLIIDADGMFTANQIVAELTSNLFTKGYFLPTRSPDIELKFQVPILWEVQTKSLIDPEEIVTTELKSLLDVVFIDHRKGLVLPVDLKTGGEGFMKSYWRYHRYLQGAMYTDAVRGRRWQRHDEAEREYEVEPMRFVFADTNLIHPPVVWCMSQLDVLGGKEGIPYLALRPGISAGGKDEMVWVPTDRIKRKGYLQLIAELDWHTKMDQWRYSYDTYQKNGEMEIDAFEIRI
jgi:hypothetical protein